MNVKFWGIKSDQMSSTHPICGHVETSEEAESLLDGISYGKGSSWLKQVYYVLGYDILKAGLHDYFKKHEWKNTTLTDFVGSLNDAYQKSGEKSMGDDFDFKEWCDSWLLTSGVNILEPEVEYNEDHSIKSLKVKQTCDLRGKNQLRKHKLSISIYDNEFKQHAKDLVISDKEALNSFEVDFKGPVKAIVVNHGDHTYSKIRFDNHTLTTFENELFKIDDFTDRSMIWGNLWLQVLDG